MGWYKDEAGEQQISGATYSTSGSTLVTNEESVWVKIDGIGCKAVPSSINLTPENPQVDVTIIMHEYIIYLSNLPIAWISWYKDEECTQELMYNTPDNYFYSGEDSVWALIQYQGYADKKVHLTYPNHLTETVTLDKLYTYSVTVTPSDASSLTYTWFEDADTTIRIDNATSNSLTTILENVWVKISADDYGDEIVSLDKDHTSKNVELSSRVEVSVLPMTQCNRSDRCWGVAAEDALYLTVVSNNKNKKINYNISVDNTYQRDSSQIFTIGNQIDIDDNTSPYSIFITQKKGYSLGTLNSTTGTFTIKSDYSDDVIFTVEANQGTQHNSHIRAYGEYGIFSNVHIIPYSEYNINKDIILKGVSDGAAAITENSLYFYEGGEDADDIPTKEITFNCSTGYQYYKYIN